MVEAGEFTWSRPFWLQPLWRWDAMFAAGVRAHYRASQLAAGRMVDQRHGLIVNISHWALATDPDVLRHTGHVHVVADLARAYGFTDLDGTTPRALTLADV